MHNHNKPSFFFTKRTRAPQGEWLGQINPFSIMSSNWTFSSFSSSGVSRYGALKIGSVLGIYSMLNTISRFGSSPGKSFRNTDTQSLTIGISSGVNSISLLRSAILARNPISNFLALRIEITETVCFQVFPETRKALPSTVENAQASSDNQSPYGESITNLY